MAPGLVVKQGSRIRIRQLQEADIPRWMAANGPDRASAERLCREELAKPDGPPIEQPGGPPMGGGKQFSVETTDGTWVSFTGFGAAPGGDAGGYFYIEPSARGKGYGEEMVRCVLDVMFDDCGAR